MHFRWGLGNGSASLVAASPLDAALQHHGCNSNGREPDCRLASAQQQTHADSDELLSRESLDCGRNGLIAERHLQFHVHASVRLAVRLHLLQDQYVHCGHIDMRERIHAYGRFDRQVRRQKKIDAGWGSYQQRTPAEHQCPYTMVKLSTQTDPAGVLSRR